jgi:hypothetical protein
MPERAAVYAVTQIGKETTPGTAVTAAARLLCTSIRPKLMKKLKPYRPQGFNAPTTLVSGKALGEAAIEGTLCYNDLSYLLSGILEQAAISTPAGATNTREWLFLPPATAPSDACTFTLENGQSGGLAERAAYCLIDTLAVRWNEDDAAVSGSAIIRKPTQGVTINGAPTSIAALPVDPENVSVFMGTSFNTNHVMTLDMGDASAGTFTLTFFNPFTGLSATTAGIAFNANAATIQTAIRGLATVTGEDVTVTGTGPFTITFVGTYAGFAMLGAQNVGQALTADFTGLTQTTTTLVQATQGGLVKQLRALGMEWGVQGRYTPIITQDGAEPSFAAHVEKAPTLSASVIVEHDANSQTLVAALEARTQYYCAFVAEGPIIESDYRNRIEILFPFKFLGEPDPGDEQDVFTYNYALEPLYDATLTSWCRVKVRNNLAALL